MRALRTGRPPRRYRSAPSGRRVCRWARPPTERLVGECQTCHAPHGVDDGSGTPIAKLLKAKGTALCYTCHGTGSTIATDMQSMDPTVAAGVPEVIVGFGASASTVQFGRVQVYSRQTAAQATLDQAREFLTGSIGPVTTGDFDGDGVPELLVARDGAAAVTAMTASALSGLRDDPGDMLLLGPADHMVLADVIDDINNRPEIVTAQGTTLRFYRWNGVSLGLVESLSTSGTITGLARGNILGTDRDEVAVTTNAPDRLVIITGTTGTLSTAGPYPTRLLPKGPSVGDMTGDGLGEISVANSGETTAWPRCFSLTAPSLRWRLSPRLRSAPFRRSSVKC